MKSEEWQVKKYLISFWGLSVWMCGIHGKSITKNGAKNGEFCVAARAVCQRRTRSLPTPHATIAIFLCEVARRPTRNLTENYAGFDIGLFGPCIFFASCLKMSCCNRLVSIGNSI
ncbi:MAG: hypothetical protein IJK51_05260 [Bacteroidaceae bacterium]|nr:hypothetical protein [Bacteroidaceae bacterium]